jgi:lactoylglutathione lyase
MQLATKNQEEGVGRRESKATVNSDSSAHPAMSLAPGEFCPGGRLSVPQLSEKSPTVGYKLNHFMLRIRDPAPTLEFYVNLMGMRTVFSFNGGPFTIYYLGYPSTELDRADLEAWATKLTTPGMLGKTLGLLELKHIHGSERPVEEGGYEISNGNQPPNMGFGHLGFTVPDVGAAVQRLRAAGVKILKELDVAEREHIPLTEWEACRGVGVGDLHDNYKMTFKKVAFVADPVS